MNLAVIEQKLMYAVSQVATADDPAHDLLHFKRVVAIAKSLAEKEGAKIEIVMPAAWLHDFVIIPKSDPRRSTASRLSAEKGIQLLRELNYPADLFGEIFHAIEAHSYSANIATQTLEAAIVQDADRLDGLGALGIARCFATSGIMRRSLYNEFDPFCESRAPSDYEFTVDHFYNKLFKIADTLKTRSAKIEGQRRSEVMRQYLANLAREIKAEI